MRIESTQHQPLAFSTGDRIPSNTSQASPLQDRVTLSERHSLESDENGAPTSSSTTPGKGTEKKPESAAAESELSEKEQQVVDQLRARDREVRAHEQAHKAAAGSYAQGAPTFKYETGPDGKRYAVGGEVKIDASPVPGDPRKTILKAQTIQRAANAPSNPSAQDRQVAAQAARMAVEARRELSKEQAEERDQVNETSDAPTSALEKNGKSSKASEGSHLKNTSREGVDSSENGPQDPAHRLTRELAEALRLPSHPSTGRLLDIAY